MSGGGNRVNKGGMGSSLQTVFFCFFCLLVFVMYFAFLCFVIAALLH